MNKHIEHIREMQDYTAALGEDDQMLIKIISSAIGDGHKDDSPAPGAIMLMYSDLHKKIAGLEQQVANLAALMADQ